MVKDNDIVVIVKNYYSNNKAEEVILQRVNCLDSKLNVNKIILIIMATNRIHGSNETFNDGFRNISLENRK